MRLVWVAVVPVKTLATAKSRLAPASDERRRALALSFAVDTVAALRAVPEICTVVVVTGDTVVAAGVGGPDVEVLPEPAEGGLNAAITAGVDWSRSRRADAGVVVVAADLPALRSGDVAAVLRTASAHPRTVLADREGTGTTMLTGLPDTPPRPQFGSDSLARHRAEGALVIDGRGLDRAARDVDTPDHLKEARRLGIGAATVQVLDADHDHRSVRRQATVASFDSDVQAGEVLLDDGTRLDVPAGAWRSATGRSLRRGQRVVVHVDPGPGRVRLVHLLTIEPTGEQT